MPDQVKTLYVERIKLVQHVNRKATNAIGCWGRIAVTETRQIGRDYLVLFSKSVNLTGPLAAATVSAAPGSSRTSAGSFR